MTLRAVEYVPGSFAIHRTLLRVSLALVNAFAWILIVRLLGGSLPLAAFLYGLEAFVVIMLTPISARLMRQGLFTSIASGVALLSLGCAFLALALGSVSATFSVFGPLIFALCAGAYRALYWIPYRASQRLREASLPVALASDVCTALAPLFGGYLIVVYGPAWVLYAAAAFAAFSILSLAGSHEAHEVFSWSYRQTFQKLFARAYWRYLAVSVIEGAQATALFFLWPLTIFLLVGGNLFVVGTVLCMTMLLTLAIRSILEYLHNERGVKIPYYAFVAVGASGWIMRLGVITPIQIIAVDTFQNIGNRGQFASLDLITFEQAADRGSFVDEFSALKEMGLSLGRLLMAIVVIVLAMHIDTPHTLAVSILAAAFLAMVHSLFARRK